MHKSVNFLLDIPFFRAKISFMVRFSPEWPPAEEWKMGKIDYYSDLDVFDVSRKLMLSTADRMIVVPTSSLEFILSGSVVLKSGGRRLLLHGPVVTWIPGNTPLRFINQAGELYDHLWIDFSGPRADRIIDSLSRGIPEGYLPVPDDSVRPLADYFMSMINDFRADRELYHGRIVNTLENLVWTLCQLAEPLPAAVRDDYRIRALAKEIELNPFTPRNFRRIAAGHGISYVHFRRLFRMIVGMPLTDYVRQAIQYAANLLGSGDTRIKEVALTCGFKDLSSFSRSFKKYTGKSPRDYLSAPPPDH